MSILLRLMSSAVLLAALGLPQVTTTVLIPAPQVAEASTELPFSVSIPSIHFAAPIVHVGLNAKGEMDVPSGKTNDVGWYKKGPKPGEKGSAVLDAHVYAAFKDLHKVKVGEVIYVNQKGKTLKFRVEEIEVKKLEEASAQKLFNRIDKARLNLITCEGTYIKSRGTYDHRRIVYAVLVP